MKKEFPWKKVLVLTASHIMVAAIAVCLALVATSASRDPGMRKLEQLAGMIEKYHVDDPNMNRVYDYAAAGMLTGTGDRWSYYISAAEMDAYDERKNNSYVGVGITVQAAEDGSGINVLSVTPGGPAFDGGMLPGDVIISVDGTDVKESDIDQLSDLIRGEEGTTVTIRVTRDTVPMDFTLTRRTIDVKVAEGKMLEGNVGYVKITNFNEKCASETILAVEELVEQGAVCIVFDVRNNGGGYKDELVKILDYLLPKGELFKAVDYLGNEEVDTSDASCVELPMAVLVNGNSYSAAEFFAAALEEYDWAIIGGEPTVGKGHMQVTMELNDGSAAAISIGKYYTPNGVSLADQGGLVPQIQVEVDEETAALIASGLLEPEDDAQLQAVIAVLTQKTEENP